MKRIIALALFLALISPARADKPGAAHSGRQDLSAPRSSLVATSDLPEANLKTDVGVTLDCPAEKPHAHFLSSVASVPPWCRSEVYSLKYGDAVTSPVIQCLARIPDAMQPITTGCHVMRFFQCPAESSLKCRAVRIPAGPLPPDGDYPEAAMNKAVGIQIWCPSQKKPSESFTEGMSSVDASCKDSVYSLRPGDYLTPAAAQCAGRVPANSSEPVTTSCRLKNFYQCAPKSFNSCHTVRIPPTQ
jgi:hypothetical protein